MAWEFIDCPGVATYTFDNRFIPYIAFTNETLYSGYEEVITGMGTNFIATTGPTYPAWVPVMSDDYLTLFALKTEGTGSSYYDMGGRIVCDQYDKFKAYSQSKTDEALQNGFAILINHETQRAQIYSVQVVHKSNGNVSGIYPLIDTSSVGARVYSWIVGHPNYNWTAWDQISGNNGQYRCNLTKIKSDYITVSSTTTDGTEEDFDRIGSQSSIWAIFQNMSVGAEKIVAWSGENWMTLTLVDAGIADTYNFVFKFYAPAISTTEAFYTLSRTITYGGSVPTRDLWLSFAYDEEHQAAVFLPVTYDTGTLQPGYEWGGVSATSDEMLYLYLWLQASGAGTPEYPYDTGTTDNGGNPGGAQPGDHMPTPGVPTLSGMSSGMFTVYNPTNTQLEQIGEFLWSANVIDNIRKYFNDFADNIIALYVLPCKLSNLPTKSFKVGNMQSDTITGVEYLTQRFTAVDMGSVYIKNVFDSYLDYSPFTKFELYLPGIGMQTLSADDIAAPTDPDTGTLKSVEGSTISVTYNIDLMTGLVVAMVKINGELRYQFPGKVGYSIPLTGANYTQMVTGFITAAAGLVGAAATGGLSAPLSAAGVGAAVSGTVNAMKPEIHRGGNLSGDVSSISERTPYIICHRPNKPLLENQERYTGFPSYKSGALSEFSGLTQVIDAHIEGISCTEAERAEILNLLKGGVIL